MGWAGCADGAGLGGFGRAVVTAGSHRRSSIGSSAARRAAPRAAALPV